MKAAQTAGSLTRSTTAYPKTLAGLCVIQACLLAFVIRSTAPTYDEWGHLPAGLSHLATGSFYQYRVNPPLPRILAAIPVRWHGYRIRNWILDDGTGRRTEFSQAQAFLRDNGRQTLAMFTLARWTTIPWCVLGTILIWRLGTEIYSPRAGIAAATLWAFSPTVMTFGATIVPDVPATVAGMLVVVVFTRWLTSPVLSQTIACGAAVGLAFSTKFTWILLLPILLLVLFCLGCRNETFRSRRHWIGLVTVFVIATLFLNLVYGGEGTLKPLAEFRFQSQTFGALQQVGAGNPVGDFIGSVPVPIPEQALMGLDVQKADFERGYPAYLMGQWSDRGWWYYYAVGWVLKEPICLWVLFVIGVVVRLGNRHQTHLSEIVLFAIAATVFVVVSSQTGINMHLRYALPALPAIFLIASAAFLVPGRSAIACRLLLLGFVVASLSVLPRSYAFFSYPFGGSRAGWKWLSDSNLDWGQDLPTLERWQSAYPEKRPLHVLYSPGKINVNRLGIDADSQSDALLSRTDESYRPTRAGWWAVFATPYTRPSGAWFRAQTPSERPSPTLRIYYVSEDTASSIRPADRLRGARVDGSD